MGSGDGPRRARPGAPRTRATSLSVPCRARISGPPAGRPHRLSAWPTRGGPSSSPARLSLDRPGRPVTESDDKEAPVGITDKVTGRIKKAAGDIADDESLRREGRQEERKGEAKDELARDQERADAKAEEVANLERKTA